MLLGFILNDRKSKIAIHGEIGLYAVICYIILTRTRNQIIHNRPCTHFRFYYKIIPLFIVKLFPLQRSKVSDLAKVMKTTGIF